ncbi:MAG: DUF4255 domain-containing protein [Thermosynechococcaceae cyanobacterium]
MNSGLAIASITAVLKNLLEDGLVQNTALSSMGNILVTTLPPDQISVGVDGQPQLNLFLYQVSQNRNADWIGQNSQQTNSGHFPHSAQASIGSETSQLAINLHYLITVYGTQDFQTEMLLGCVMQLMHQSPVLSNDAIRNSLKHAASMNRAGPFAQAVASNSFDALINQLGQVQIAPDLFDTEQMSRLWSLLQGSYRPSVTYEVSMISISSEQPSSIAVTNAEGPALDDRERPVIEKVMASPATNGAIIPGCDLILYGKHLDGDITKVRLNEDELTPTIVEDIRLLVKLPPTLQAGVHQIQVIHKEVTNPLSESGMTSSRLSFKLHPQIKASAKTSNSNGQEQTEGTTVMVRFNPKIAEAQQVVLKFMAADEYSDQVFTVSAPPRDSETDAVEVVVNDIPSGLYLVQAQVDGADSFLDLNQRDHRVMIQTQTLASSSGDEEMSETEYQDTALIEGNSETEETALEAQPKNENSEIEDHHEDSVKDSNTETESVDVTMSRVGNLDNKVETKV